jgi:hypothetical protein
MVLKYPDIKSTNVSQDVDYSEPTKNINFL